MDELVRLMRELGQALEARSEAAAQTESLARDVLAHPKLPPLAAAHSDPRADELLRALQTRMRDQEAAHAADEALACARQLAAAAALLRDALGEMLAGTQQHAQNERDALAAGLAAAKARYAELQLLRQDQLLQLARDLHTLERLAACAASLE